MKIEVTQIILDAIAKEIFLKNHEFDETAWTLDEEEIMEIIYKHLNLPKQAKSGPLPKGLLKRVRTKKTVSPKERGESK